MACMFMSDQHAIENIKRYPEQIWPYIQSEIKLAHTWKSKKSLEELWGQCLDMDDVEGNEDLGKNDGGISKERKTNISRGG